MQTATLRQPEMLLCAVNALLRKVASVVLHLHVLDALHHFPTGKGIQFSLFSSSCDLGKISNCIWAARVL